MGSIVRRLLALALVAAPALPAGGEEATISGQIIYFGNAEAVPDASVVVAGADSMTAPTGADGNYGASQAAQQSVAVEPVKQGDFAGAITPLDAARVLQALVGLTELDAFSTIACDVTGDGSVSALDAAHILRFAVGNLARFAAAEACESDWVFVPAAEPAANQETQQPQIDGPSCTRGGIRYDPLAGSVSGQDFIAILLGDCSGNWGGDVVEETPTATVVASATPTFTPLPSPSPSATWTHTQTHTPSATTTPTATFSATASPTPSWTTSAMPTRTATPTRTGTATRSATATRTATRTSSATRTRTFTRTPTVTRTATLTRTATPTRTHTITRTPTITQTPSHTPTSSPTPTAVCANGTSWQLSMPVSISTQLGGALWLADTVTTDDGWGIFWLRDDPGFSSVVRLYYAHVDTSGEVTHGPMLIDDIPKITWRQRYYMAAWHEDHFAVITAEYATLYYHSMSKGGALTGRRAVGPNLLYSSVWDSEADGDIDSYPDGFVAVVEGECVGHSCSYGFKLSPSGTETAFVNLVDFDLTHQFYPRAAYDGDGFALLSVKDIQVQSGGVMTKYWQANGQMKPHVKVVPTKQYNWDEFPDLAYNGDHFAAVWTENAIRQHGANWQIRFATFRRDGSGGSVIADRVLDGPGEKSLHRWTTRVHPSGNDWLVHYARREAAGHNQAVFEILDSAANTRETMAPFALTADALGSSPHPLPELQRTLGVVRGDNGVGETQVVFYFLDPPSCR